jgi:soluble epoxide hydrolase/lipid-phosphate phosphatase
MVQNNERIFQHECDKYLPKEVDFIDIPVLSIRGEDDAMGRPETMYAAVEAGLSPH